MQPATETTPAHAIVQVRPASARAELLEFTQWHHLAGVPQSRPAGRNLVEVADAGILSTGLTRSYAAEKVNDPSIPGGIPTLLAARTMALVAVADNRPIGGLAAGPSFFLCAQLAMLGPATVLQAALATIKIHALAVKPGWRRCGIGTALLSHALTTACDAGASVVYGQFNTDAPGLAEFYHRNGMNVSEPDAPLQMNALIDLPAYVAPLPGETLFHRVVNQ
ncbi:GNAT family N-acetyltransferase [Nocardia asiatica]|uniref:GNAT family N-acetyltransferase n=1 Tax=Nocardia asiatica TaxID=209252 RepID=UPI0002F70880|nr:GNAT family N-acetyltransferase [Nocardia asiatica]